MARPPFAEAQLAVIDEEQVRFTFRSPSRSGQRELVLHPLAWLRRLAWLRISPIVIA
ncbi:MAG: transposase [Kofleriaceae bacterium]|nr:transposase [Kofleriaceae bacterium]